MSIDGQTILVTGGTGSLGRRFTEIALTRYSPRRIIIFSRDELKQHDMRAQFTDPRLTFFIGTSVNAIDCVAPSRRRWTSSSTLPR